MRVGPGYITSPPLNNLILRKDFLHGLELGIQGSHSRLKGTDGDISPEKSL